MITGDVAGVSVLDPVGLVNEAVPDARTGAIGER